MEEPRGSRINSRRNVAVHDDNLDDDEADDQALDYSDVDDSTGDNSKRKSNSNDFEERSRRSSLSSTYKNYENDLRRYSTNSFIPDQSKTKKKDWKEVHGAISITNSRRSSAQRNDPPDEVDEALKDPNKKLTRKIKSSSRYKDECGYWLVSLFIGHSFSRVVKRRLLRYTLTQILIGIALIILSSLEDNNFPGSSYFESSKYGLSVRALMYLTSIPSFLLGCCSSIVLCFWQSLMTNKLVLVKVMYTYIVIDILTWLMCVWCICAISLTISSIKSWKVSLELELIRPYFIATLVLLCPFALDKIYNLSELSYLIGEIAGFGAEDEIDAPSPSIDLSGLQVRDAVITLFTAPFYIIYRVLRVMLAVAMCQPINELDQDGVSPGLKDTNQRSCVARCCRSIHRMWRKTLAICYVTYELLICCDFSDLTDRWATVKSSVKEKWKKRKESSSSIEGGALSNENKKAKFDKRKIADEEFVDLEVLPIEKNPHNAIVRLDENYI